MISIPTVIPIVIRNVNDPTIIAYNPSGDLVVFPLGSTDTDSNPDHVSITGITLQDPDKNVDVIRVTIRTANGGLLTISDPSLVDFTSVK